MKYYIDSNGEYYFGDKYGDDHIEVPERPSINHKYVKNKWVIDKQSSISDITDKIKELRDKLINSGVYVNGYWFKTDIESRLRYSGLVLLSESELSNVIWKTMNGTLIGLDHLKVNDILVSIIKSDINIFSIAEDHINKLNKCKDPVKYDYSVGWPSTYK